LKKTSARKRTPGSDKKKKKNRFSTNKEKAKRSALTKWEKKEFQKFWGEKKISETVRKERTDGPERGRIRQGPEINREGQRQKRKLPKEKGKKRARRRGEKTEKRNWYWFGLREAGDTSTRKGLGEGGKKVTTLNQDKKNRE